VLAMRTDPPEVFIDANDPVQVRFSALVVDPREAPLASNPLQYRWTLCPVESNEACLDYETFRTTATADQQTFLDNLRTVSDGGTAFLEPQDKNFPPEVAATRAAWPYEVTPFDLTLTQSQTTALASYFLSFNFLGLGMGSLPLAVLDVTGIDDAITAAKRFTFNIQDVGRAEQTLGIALPYQVCTDENRSDGCVALLPRIRNTNPTFDRIQVAVGSNAGSTYFDVPGSYRMRAGERIRVNPVMTGDSFESYQELVTDPGTGAIAARDRIEIISVSWFASVGEVEDDLTTPLFTKGLDTEYRAPRSVAPSGQPVSIYMVARDQRGGVAWTNLEVTVDP
ncbi:MAG: hypothetical protein H7Z43_02895, partial [Clostridia bacterium]|nr:hypothetical protein [Deltaproteobacteria bacterium]